ncbi:MAG: tetratricopeptide repeat protein, partial [Chloroflexi bacterium]|nr:tetratricopeptide repeat protein [Chloroflexota bacterium]
MRHGHSAAWDQQWDRAIAAYRKAIEEFPEDPNALSSLGLALLQAKRLDEALAMYNRAAKLAPDDPVPLEKSSDILERLGRLDDASQQYMAAAEIHLTRRDVDKAIDNWSRASRLAPGRLVAHQRLALAYERTGKTRQAVVEYMAVARIFQRNGDNEKAAQAIERARP